MKLYYDDIRYPPGPDWLWARTNEEAIRILETCNIQEASLDHDMGLHEYNPMEIDFAELSDDWCDPDHDGYTLALEMIELELVPPKITIHSWNPVGAKNMESVLKKHAEMIIIKPAEEWLMQ